MKRAASYFLTSLALVVMGGGVAHALEQGEIAVSEPGSLLLIGSAIVGLAGLRRKIRSR